MRFNFISYFSYIIIRNTKPDLISQYIFNVALSLMIDWHDVTEKCRWDYH